jgi:hypothetical protein
MEKHKCIPRDLLSVINKVARSSNQRTIVTTLSFQMIKNANKNIDAKTVSLLVYIHKILYSPFNPT